MFAFAAMAAPALAKKEAPKVQFGKFIASLPGTTISEATPATATGHGEVLEGPKGPGIELAGGALTISKCTKELSGTGKVVSEKSETFLQNVTFKDCYAQSFTGKNKEIISETKLPTFKLAIEFHSNQSAVAGESETGEVKIKENSTVVIPVPSKKSPCAVTIPAQTIPTKAATKPEREYESAFYATETETVEGKKKLERFPRGFYELLDVETEFSKVETWVKPGEHCLYTKGEEGSFDKEEGTPAFGYVVYAQGYFFIEIEEIKIKNGNLGFETKAEVEAEEAV
ncbi:MAG TPA: hypothetical protein VK721_13980 [Solirubrobacteraceae bacterium]|nr:hypothetical protein [Solirubrobacteraceae bacterium]